MQMKQTTIVVIELCSLVLLNAYIIERRANITRFRRRLRWIDLPDTFIIPSSICLSGSSAKSTQCSQMGANYESICKCMCKEQRSTFGFYEDEWKCFENTKVHSYGGNCSITIEDKPTSEVLRVMPMSSPTTIYYLSMRDLYCTLTGKSYLMCNGNWEQLNETLFDDRLKVHYYPDDHQSDGAWYLEYYTGQNSTPTINGRVMKLEFQCSDGPDSHTSTHCVLFKVKGTLTCSLSPTSSSSLMLSTPITPTSTVIIPLKSSPTPSTTTRLRPSPSILPTPSILPIPSISSSGLKDSTKTTTLPGSIQTAVAATTATVPLPTIIATDVNSPTVRYETPTTWKSVKTNIVTSPTLVEHREKNKQTDDDNSTGLIAGALAGIIGLAIIICIIVVIRKRKNRDNDSKRTTAENEGYGRGADISLRFTNHGQRPPDEDEYSYAYTTTVPFAKTNKRISMENNTNSNQGIESDNSVANLIYGKTEELNKPDSSPHHEASLYNTLEEPDYAKLDKSMIESPAHCDGPSYDSSKEPVYAKVDKGRKKKSSDNINEPLYNVLEGPETDHEDTTLEGLNDEPPCYHVPKGTYPDGAPLYDVLEGPEAPVYGSLEGQDPHIYGALNLRDSRATFEENQGNEDMVYDSVGDVINDTGNIYQQLNQSGQRCSDVYQALSYPDKTMHLNELNESHSSA